MKAIHTAVDEIFATCPDLYGFSVQDADTLGRGRASAQLEGNLYLADVSTTPYAQQEGVLGAIAVALLELIDEEPKAAEELRGRTFARTLH
jgi:hypothetical protein